MAPQEVFTVSGIAPDVRYARAAAWNGLRQILGPESEEPWQFRSAQYQLSEIPDSDSPDPNNPTMVTACWYEIELVRVPVEVDA